jgi:hypothetical protein
VPIFGLSGNATLEKDRYMRLILALALAVAGSSAMSAETQFSERTILTGHAITVTFLNPNRERTKTSFYCSSSISEGVDIMGHDRMGGVVMLAPSVAVLKKVDGDDADSAPYIRIDCRSVTKRYHVAATIC